ncbi:GTPase-associated system all-helical protein GASH [Ensifer sp. NPDC090286]|uniref:GTPase-associated system all-helical protein GASH n=1 Tax=Ensifer sp. NPDC090286 TaxID=3363991 RepID=UPI00383B6D63
MHSDFPRWYSSLSMGEDQGRRQARWAAVHKIASQADRDTVEALLRLAFKTRALPAAAQVASIRAAFQSTDDTFEMAGNDRELQILSAACLAVLPDFNEDVGVIAALAVTTTDLNGGRKPDLPMDLAKLAEAAISEWADSNRQRPDLTKYMNSDSPKLDFEKAAAKITETQNWEGISAAFKLAAESTGAAMRSLATRQSNAIRAVDRFISIQDEELQMLWWLTGQRSWDYDCSFDSVAADAQPLVLSKEVAAVTASLPGPSSVMAILSRAGLKDRRKLALTSAVNAVETDWLREVMGESDPSPVSTPVHAAIKRQLETGPGDAWVAGWAAATGIAAGYGLSPLALAMQFYRERLLLTFE